MDMAEKRFQSNKISKPILLLLVGVILVPVFLALLMRIEFLLYQPLSKGDFSKLFPTKVLAIKYGGQDAIKLSMHGELFELHSYILFGGSITPNYPLEFDSLNGYNLPSKSSIHHWEKCLSEKPVEFDELPTSKAKNRFARKWNNPSYYRCFIYVDEQESYWFVFSPKEKRFYYLAYNL